MSSTSLAALGIASRLSGTAATCRKVKLQNGSKQQDKYALTHAIDYCKPASTIV